MSTTFLFLLLLPLNIVAQSYSNISSVVDGLGSISAGGMYTNLSAAAQPSSIGISSGGTLVNYSGFLNTFSLRPNLDTDGDGLANEVDSDNDNDQLSDAAELAGTAFTPTTVTDINNPDSDGDGANDGNEATAGTNPDDLDSLFKIIGISHNPSEATVSWTGRSGKTYYIYQSDDLVAGATNLMSTTNVTGGTAPWYATTNSFVDTTASATNKRFYLIKVQP